MQATRTFDLTPARIARFWSKVDRCEDDECWPWVGEKHTSGGYGMYSEWSDNQRICKFYAHRLSVLISGREIAGLVVRHDCDNPPCVNPSHLQTGSQADNVRDAYERGRMNLTGLAIGQARKSFRQRKEIAS